uniref:Uncharacterized protein n=1 Tax=Chromera velia CCMP2878 TaxID=1169474 RepID=A0A0G4EZP4_9ALVE|eukprot:Cvel_2592.t1-p1 / transcript=Cvel_2592.t1 / gene=Cvel_2592 / organism=Chromera_velia_CCMP2878 / gene_product=hypothetical protein / transcript_product=hypothetical protein / location=Cvel_scaffold102:111595-112137(+) / protein_length=181 / sequence_SO=supercontig / SO=protein_coding / is_pseudo=false
MADDLQEGQLELFPPFPKSTIEAKHYTVDCPKYNMPVRCNQPLCQAQTPPLKHKAKGCICQAFHSGSGVRFGELPQGRGAAIKGPGAGLHPFSALVGISSRSPPSFLMGYIRGVQQYAPFGWIKCAVEYTATGKMNNPLKDFVLGALDVPPCLKPRRLPPRTLPRLKPRWLPPWALLDMRR